MTDGRETLKQLRADFSQLSREVREGFKAINERLSKLEVGSQLSKRDGEIIHAATRQLSQASENIVRLEERLSARSRETEGDVSQIRADFADLKKTVLNGVTNRIGAVEQKQGVHDEKISRLEEQWQLLIGKCSAGAGAVSTAVLALAKYLGLL